MNRYIDITLPLDGHLPTWPDSPGFELEQVAWLDQDGCNETRLHMGSHVGTHVDAPGHFVAGGATVDRIPLEVLIGMAYVVDVGSVVEVSAEVLAKLKLPDNLERLLLKTTNSLWWAACAQTFREDFVALTLDGAKWLARKGIRLVGVDYLSVQRYGDANDTHVILLEADVVLLEGLNLAGVDPGVYELICLPLPIIDGEGAPARAILRKLPAQGIGR